MATTVTSDAEFKTYVEGLTAFTTDTVYMNDDSKYWTFTRENNGKINAMCVTSNNVELWMYDGTDWVINRVPSVINNLTNTSINDALSANQGKVLNEKIENPTVKTGSFVANTGVTISEVRIKQTGKVIEVHMYAILTNTSTNPFRIGRITGVDLPPIMLRMFTGTGTVAYQAIRPAYITCNSDGGMDLFRSQVSDTVVNIDFMYTVD